MRLKRIICLAVLLVLAAPTVACAYTAEITPFDEEHAAQEAQKAVEERTKEKEAQAAQEHKAAEEQKAREEQSQHPASERQRNEEAPTQAGEAAARQCVVPALKGDILTQARQALRQAHCKLGHVTGPPRGHGRHVVTRQGLRAGSKHPAGTAVAVTLGPVKLGR